MGVAAYGVVANLSIVAFAIFNGLAQGAQPLISESYGKGQPTQVKKLLKWSLLVCFAVEALIQLIIWTSTDTLISIFNSENNVQLLNYAHTGLRLYLSSWLGALEKLFDRFETEGRVTVPNETVVYLGKC